MADFESSTQGIPAAAGAFDFGRPRRQPGGGDVVFRFGRQPRRVELDCVERRQHVAGGNEGELLDMKLAALSGGNAQKVLLAKWLDVRPRLPLQLHCMLSSHLMSSC